MQTAVQPVAIGYPVERFLGAQGAQLDVREHVRN